MGDIRDEKFITLPRLELFKELYDSKLAGLEAPTFTPEEFDIELDNLEFTCRLSSADVQSVIEHKYQRINIQVSEYSIILSFMLANILQDGNRQGYSYSNILDAEGVNYKFLLDFSDDKTTNQSSMMALGGSAELDYATDSDIDELFAEPEIFNVSYTLLGCSSDNPQQTIVEGSSYIATVTSSYASTRKWDVALYMGGTDITTSDNYEINGDVVNIHIANVTGELNIMLTAYEASDNWQVEWGETDFINPPFSTTQVSDGASYNVSVDKGTLINGVQSSLISAIDCNYNIFVQMPAGQEDISAEVVSYNSDAQTWTISIPSVNANVYGYVEFQDVVFTDNGELYNSLQLARVNNIGCSSLSEFELSTGNFNPHDDSAEAHYADAVTSAMPLFAEQDGYYDSDGIYINNIVNSPADYKGYWLCYKDNGSGIYRPYIFAVTGSETAGDINNFSSIDVYDTYTSTGGLASLISLLGNISDLAGDLLSRDSLELLVGQEEDSGNQAEITIRYFFQTN